MNSITQEIPSVDLLEKIIIDDKYFFEFSNNKDSMIYGFKIQELQTHLRDYIKSCLSRKDVSMVFLERAKYYNDKFNLDIPQFRKVNDGLNPDFEKFIMAGIDNYTNPLVAVRMIYLKLAQVLCYDEHFPAYNQNLANPIMQELYYTRSSEVTLENNKVTCALWANVYVLFLQKLGIDAKVIVNDKHKLVEFTIEGVRYTADATNSFLDKDNIYVNDFTRVKLNSPTVGFPGANNIDDQQIGFNPKTLIEQYHEFSNNHTALSSMRLSTGNADTDLLISKLDYLSTLVFHLPQIEAVAYLKQMLHQPNSIITEDEIKKLMPRQIRLKDEHDLVYTALVIVVKNGDDYIYKLLHVPEGLITVEKTYFENLIANGEMLDDGNIPGLNQFSR